MRSAGSEAKSCLRKPTSSLIPLVSSRMNASEAAEAAPYPRVIDSWCILAGS